MWSNPYTRHRNSISVGTGVGFGASTYWGNIATKVRIPSAVSTTNKTATSRSHHIARDNISSLKIELPNWYWARSTVGPETNGGGNITYTASVEYPAGTFTQIKFAGNASTVVASGNSVLSDECAVSIPNGASFWIRTFANAATAIVFTDSVTGFPQRDLGNGEAYEYSASTTTDKTMSGTITDNGATAAPIFVPTAIIALTKKPTILLIGDSRMWGFNDTLDSSGDLGEFARSIGPSCGYINAGSSGDFLSSFITSHSKRTALKQYVSHVVVETAINALRSGGTGQAKTAATVLGEQQTVLGYFSDKPCFTSTIAPNSTSSDSWATSTNQTVNANEAQIILYNDAIRAGVAGSVGYFEVADVFETARNSGKWIFPSYTSDGLHTNQTGYLLLKNSGNINPSRFTR